MNHPWTWRVLADAQITRIREAALAHIERHGFVVQHAALKQGDVSGRLRGAVAHSGFRRLL